jgi:hypothetical protein
VRLKLRDVLQTKAASEVFMTTTRSSSRTKSSGTTKSSGSKSRSTTSKPKASTASRTKASARTAAHRRTSTGAAHKTGSKTAHGQAWTNEHSKNPSSTGHGKAKKEPAKQTSACWPGYEPVPGKPRGAKGSCKPKAHQTSAEKKSDAMAASASKLRKAGNSKARANHSR